MNVKVASSILAYIIAGIVVVVERILSPTSQKVEWLQPLDNITVPSVLVGLALIVQGMYLSMVTIYMEKVADGSSERTKVSRTSDLVERTVRFVIHLQVSLLWYFIVIEPDLLGFYIITLHACLILWGHLDVRTERNWQVSLCTFLQGAILLLFVLTMQAAITRPVLGIHQIEPLRLMSFLEKFPYCQFIFGTMLVHCIALFWLMGARALKQLAFWAGAAFAVLSVALLMEVRRIATAPSVASQQALLHDYPYRSFPVHNGDVAGAAVLLICIFIGVGLLGVPITLKAYRSIKGR